MALLDTEKKDDMLQEENTKEEMVAREKEVKKNEEPVNDVVDIDLSVTRKKRFRINGDNDKILELNTSDMGILKRLEKTYPKLDKLAAKAKAEVGKDTTDESVAEMLEDIDLEMRNLLDELFDSNVSEVCAPNGTMYDPFSGEFRFEHIIKTLIDLYDTNMSTEFRKMSNRIKSHTQKYTKK